MRALQVTVLLLIGLLSGCILPDTSHAQDTTETPAPSLEVTTTIALLPGALGPLDYPADVNPLTGLQVADLSVLERPPVVVKISNAPPLVRPQSGIGQADLVFEHYAEGGLTRFSAIFYSQMPQKAGSVRSARLIDYELVPMYRALLAFSGASLGVEKRIYGSEVVKENLCRNREGEAREACEQDADVIGPAGAIPPSEFADRAFKGVLYGAPYYWRDESIPVPHNMFVNVAALSELAASQGISGRPDLHGMAFHADPNANAAALVGPAQVIDIRYRATRIRWQYDAEAGRYRRFADGQGHFDATTQEQIMADNVVVVYAGHYLTDIVEAVWQESVSWSIQVTIWPEGAVSLFRDGQRYDGRWVRAVREDLLSLQTNDGQILYFKPGNTWFQLVQLPEQMNPAEEWVRVDPPES